jgi:hypothetical protein
MESAIWVRFRISTTKNSIRSVDTWWLSHKNGAVLPTVVNVTAGAVTFQLRAWTDRYHEWVQLRGDLSVAVNDALAREKIVIA